MAGGPITVTDRISVRVTAKNQEQSASQKRDVGGSIAKTLGNENVSDSLKDQLGNTKNPVITDENGDTWVSEEDVIDAGKAMKENGAFDGAEYETYETPYGIVIVHCSSFNYKTWNRWHHRDERGYYVEDWGGDGDDVTKTGDLYVACGGKSISYDRQTYTTIYIYNASDSGDASMMYNSDPAWVTPDANYNGTLSLTVLENYANGTTPMTKTGDYGGSGSLIDWTKPDNEIDPQIHELFETMRTKEGKDYVKVAIATESSGESGSGDSGSGGGHTGGDF